MNQVEAIRRALAELGDVSAEELATFALARYGVKVEPRFVPVIKATIRDKESMAAFYQRRAAQAAVTATANPHSPAA